METCEFVDELRKLSLREGDVVLIKRKSRPPQPDTFAIDLTNAVKELNIQNILLIMVHDDFEVSNLTEDDMSKHGWYRNRDQEILSNVCLQALGVVEKALQAQYNEDFISLETILRNGLQRSCKTNQK